MELAHTMMELSQMCYKWVSISLQSGSYYRHELCQCYFHGTVIQESARVLLSKNLHRTSVTNCAHQYNQLNNSEPLVGWQFGFAVTIKQVWDGFVILALLEDCQ